MSARGELSGRQAFRPGQLAVLCRVDVRTVRQWALRGLVRFVGTPGGHRRYRRADLPFLPPSGDPQLLTIEEAAAELGVTGRSVATWIRRRQMYHVQLPGAGRRRVWRSDVDALRSVSGSTILHD